MTRFLRIINLFEEGKIREKQQQFEGFVTSFFKLNELLQGVRGARVENEEKTAKIIGIIKETLHCTQVVIGLTFTHEH